MKKIILFSTSVIAFTLVGCSAQDTGKANTEAEPAAAATEAVCPEGDTRCETGGGLIDPNRESTEEECPEGESRCETGGGLIDPD